MTWKDVFKGFMKEMRNLIEFGKMWEEKEGVFMHAAVRLEREWVQWTGLERMVR